MSAYTDEPSQPTLNRNHMMRFLEEAAFTALLEKAKQSPQSGALQILGEYIPKTGEKNGLDDPTASLRAIMAWWTTLYESLPCSKRQKELTCQHLTEVFPDLQPRALAFQDLFLNKMDAAMRKSCVQIFCRAESQQQCKIWNEQLQSLPEPCTLQGLREQGLLKTVEMSAGYDIFPDVLRPGTATKMEVDAFFNHVVNNVVVLPTFEVDNLSMSQASFQNVAVGVYTYHIGMHMCPSLDNEAPSICVYIKSRL